MRSRVMLFPLLNEYRVATTGAGGAKTTLDLDVPGIKSILPHCEALFLITNTRVVAPASPLEWNVSLISGFDRAREDQPIDLSPSVLSAAVNKRSADYTVVGNFLLESRLQVWWANPVGASGEKSAIISAVLGARLFGE